MIRRFSSRHEGLDDRFLNQRFRGVRGYYRESPVMDSISSCLGTAAVTRRMI